MPGIPYFKSGLDLVESMRKLHPLSYLVHRCPTRDRDWRKYGAKGFRYDRDVDLWIEELDHTEESIPAEIEEFVGFFWSRFDHHQGAIREMLQ